ncbi:hypothetical protein [Candidatus Fukatsuia symbiotica]|uniref:hypothetical protein n=1 Tax=Candidatus Fukatsuia symbiotica TaxID=1878942 RepID=UPI0013C4880A|nr:hypothetical protein [Candidatus Fukatsuia symbiotica]
MPHTYGYATHGKRCYDKQDWQSKRQTHVITAFIAGVLSAACLCLFNIDNKVFHTSIVESLLA